MFQGESRQIRNGAQLKMQAQQGGYFVASRYGARGIADPGLFYRIFRRRVNYTLLSHGANRSIRIFGAVSLALLNSWLEMWGGGEELFFVSINREIIWGIARNAFLRFTTLVDPTKNLVEMDTTEIFS